MKQYKYILDKSSKKFNCPSCGKRTFVRFVDVETGDYTSDEFGRCDREKNCGYHIPPTGNQPISEAIAPQLPQPPTYHDHKLVADSGRNYKNNNFIQFLKTLFTDDEVKNIITKYLIGTSKHWLGATIFWQIDNEENVRAGKILQYVKESGKRYKTPEGRSLINWVHKALKLGGFNLKQCLFGLHLINEQPNQIAAIVESEKTAIIMSLFKPEITWLATGSKNGFKMEMLRPIKHLPITAFPDKGEYSDWKAKADEMQRFGYDIKVSGYLETLDIETGSDLADVYLKLRAEEPEAKPETVDLSNFNHVEVQVYRLEQQNPALRLLIDTFDLTDNYGREIKKIG